MIYTLSNISTAPSYDALIRNGFNDIEVVAFYGTAKEDRGEMLRQIKIGLRKSSIIAIETPIKVINNNATQMCTVNSLAPMVAEHMSKDFVYRGRTFNMKAMGWTFEWSNKKNAFGACVRSGRRNRFTGETTLYNKRIQLSKWLVANSESTFEEWVDTMLHEIAHAIDVEIRGTSDHTYVWKSIASSVGARPERTTDVGINSNNSKYSITCPNGHKSAGHKYSKIIAEGRRSCGKCSDTFDRRYLLTQIQNY